MSSSFFTLVRLPSPELQAEWDSVITPSGLKSQLVRYLSVLRSVQGIDPTRLALRRALLLYGPPGCGKTTLARSLGHVWAAKRAKSEGIENVALLHVNTHAISSGVRGEAEKNVLQLFKEIGELATSPRSQLFVLLDEVETLGANRANLSMDTNPLDALTQVTVFLESLDAIGRERPNVTFIFTTNIPRLIDRAVTERVDFTIEVPLPDPDARRIILHDTLDAIVHGMRRDGSRQVGTVAGNSNDFTQVVALTDGLSGRELRHLALLALSLKDDPGPLTTFDLEAAARHHQKQLETHRRTKGVYSDDYQR